MLASHHIDTHRHRYRAGHLVLFAGAGVAQAGGLPSWPAEPRGLAHQRPDHHQELALRERAHQVFKLGVDRVDPFIVCS